MLNEEEIRLDQTKKVFEALADFVINGSGSYRYLIYDKLGFECKDYADLIAGLTITNAIVELEDLREENQELEEQLDKYENPEDMTLMMMWCTEKVKDENKELKKHLKVPENCNLKTLEDYKNYYEDTTREQILADTYIDYCAYVNLAHKYSELNKQLKNYKRLGFKYLQDKNNNLETQQKEFIKWLEDYINLFDKKDIYEEGSCDTIEEILKKYKEIIGVEDEKEN